MNESNIGGVSIRAILVLLLVTVFLISIFTSFKNDTLNALTTGAVGWYFGQKSPTTPTKPTDTSA